MSGRGALVVVVALLCVVSGGCAQIEKEANAVDELIVRARSDDFLERQDATRELLARDPVSVRHLVVPRLALESAMVPLQVSSRGGQVLTGRVVGGTDQSLQLEVSGPPAPGAVVSIPFTEIKTLWLSRRE